LGITVESKEEIKIIDKPVVAKKSVSKKPVYDKDDIVPTMKEAKVIRREEPKKPEKKDDSSRKDVDDLIKKKSQTEESAYKDI
jgi:hypothetical protein